MTTRGSGCIQCPRLRRGSEQGQQRVDHCQRLFTRQEMTGTCDDMARGPGWKERHMCLRAARWRHPVVGPVQHDGWHPNRWPRRQATLDLVKARVAWRIAVAVAVRGDHYGYEIRIGEGRGRPVIGGVIEV